MAALNFADLAKGVSPDAPCGVDLEDDADFMNVVARLEVALPTSFFRRDDEGRQVPFDKSTLDFAAAFADLGRLLAQTRDLRLLALAAKLALLDRDLGAFAASLDLIAACLSEHWETFHPRARGEGLVAREVALQGLDDNATIVLPLQHAPLFTSRRTGPLAFRSQLVANGETRLVEGENHPDGGTIQFALNEADLTELTRARDAARSIVEALDLIVRTWRERTGEVLGFPRLSALAGQIHGFLDAGVARRLPGQAAPAAAAATGDAMSGPVPATAGGCASILQVKDALASCLDYFRKTEPSSPAVLLIGQAQHLIGKSLIEVIQIMFPEHVDRAMIAVGQAQRFQLPLERLAAVEPEGAVEGDEVSDAEDAVADAHHPFATAVTSRGEAVSRMAAVARFYRQAEPSHPTPLLMDKACALAQHDFMALLGDILPEVATIPDDGR